MHGSVTVAFCLVLFPAEAEGLPILKSALEQRKREKKKPTEQVQSQSVSSSHGRQRFFLPLETGLHYCK
jgi:hypothetical protein